MSAISSGLVCVLRGAIGKIGVPSRYCSHPFLLKPLFNRILNNPFRYISYNMDSLGLVPDVVDKLSTEILEVWLVTIFIIDVFFITDTAAGTCIKLAL